MRLLFSIVICLGAITSCSISEKMAERTFSENRLYRLSAKSSFKASEIGTEYLFFEWNQGGTKNTQFFSPDYTDNKTYLHLGDSLKRNSNVEKVGTFKSRRKLLSYLREVADKEYNFLGLQLIKTGRREVTAWQMFPKNQEVVADRGNKRVMRAARVQSELVAAFGKVIAVSLIEVRRYPKETVHSRYLTKQEVVVIEKELQQGDIVSLGSFRNNKSLWTIFKKHSADYLGQSFDLYVFPEKNGLREVGVKVIEKGN